MGVRGLSADDVDRQILVDEWSFDDAAGGGALLHALSDNSLESKEKTHQDEGNRGLEPNSAGAHRSSNRISRHRSLPPVPEKGVSDPSNDEHRVAVAVEEVVGGDGGLISREDVLPSGEGGHEDQKGRAGEVEIRQKEVDRTKLEAGSDEQVGREAKVLLRLEAARQPAGGFERSCDRGADRHDSSSGAARRSQECECLRG